MQTQMKSLTPNEQKEVIALIRECEAYDNASACVQMDHALNGNPDMDSWFLIYRDSELAGISLRFRAFTTRSGKIDLCSPIPSCAAAYHLYRKLGFKDVRAVDYHILNQ